MSNRWFLAALLTVVATPVAAHDWYPIECCHSMDCAVVDKAETRPGPGITGFLGSPAFAATPGDLIVTTKHGSVVVPRDFPRRESKDNNMHACMRPSADGGMRLLCLFLPPAS